MSNTTYRYPGLASFTTGERDLFYGRKRETRELFNLIAVEKTVVLFSKSGYGKTSLLNAGVLPLLEHEFIYPVPIRFGDETRLPEQHFSEQFDEAYNRFMGSDQRGIDSSKSETAWEQVKRCPFVRNNTRWQPLIIFDQFEELFTLYPAEANRHQFVADLANLIQERLPLQVREKLLDKLDSGQITASESADMEKAPLMKFVFSIRSDMLHFMDELSGQMPYILRSRYQLFGLDTEAARDAILLPAALPQGDRFSTPAFGYTPEAVAEIIAGISKNKEVESFQLQVVCQALEEEIEQASQQQSAKLKRLPTNKAGLPCIDPLFYGGSQGIEQILERSYYRRLEALPSMATQLTARLLLEDQLVNENGRRRSVDVLDLLQERNGVTQELLDILKNQRLLRREPRLDSFYYEISHDTLLAPIVKSRNERRDKEEKERLTKEAAEREAQNAALSAQVQREHKLRNRARVFTIVAAGVAVLAVLAAGYGYNEAQTAKSEADRAETEKDKAKKALVAADSAKTAATESLGKFVKQQRITEAQKWLNSGDTYYGYKRMEDARDSYKKGMEALAQDSTEQLYQTLKQKWAKCE